MKGLLAGVLVVDLLLAGRAALAQPANLRTNAEAALDNVVRVESTWKDASQLGFGYLVSSSAGESIVITPRHVVATKVGNGYQVADTITVTTAGNGRFNVRKAHMPEPVADVAVLEVVTPNALFMTPAVLADKPVVDEEVWLFGFGQKLQFNGASGRVRDFTSEIIRSAFVSAWKGSSGGPLFSASGIVGFHLKSDGAHSDVLPVDVARRAALGAGKKWLLRPSLWVAASVQLTLGRLDPLAVRVVARQAGGGTLAVPGQYSAPAGDYGLEYDFSKIKCTPQSWRVNRVDPSQKVVVSCSPQLAGTWQNARLSVSLSQTPTGDLEFSSSGSQQDLTASMKGRLIQNVTQPLVFQISVTDRTESFYGGTATLSDDLSELVLDLRGLRPTSPERLRR
jgi:hypothetical protein